PGLWSGCVPHRHRRPCRRHHQGAAQGRSLARRPGLQRGPGGAVRQGAGDRDRPHERPLQRQALAGAARDSRRRAAGKGGAGPRQGEQPHPHRIRSGADRARGPLMSVVPFTGMKIFSTTLARDREQMSDNITRWLLGASLEQMWGTRRFITFYMVTGATGALVTGLIGFLLGPVWLNPYFGNWSSLEGLIAAFAVLMPTARIFLYFIPVQARWMLPISAGITLLFMLMGSWVA